MTNAPMFNHCEQHNLMLSQFLFIPLLSFCSTPLYIFIVRFETRYDSKFQTYMIHHKIQNLQDFLKKKTPIVTIFII
ncbi:hypothetical protein Hanom_Chr09g00828681 [Helianthus anomalus]